MKANFLRIKVIGTATREEAIEDVLRSIDTLGKASVSEIGKHMDSNFGYTYEYKLIYALCSHLAGAKVKRIGREMHDDGYTRYFIL